MNVFMDTNILLDVLARRTPFFASAAAVWTLAERGDIRAHISAISFNNMYYIVRKAENAGKAHRALCILRDLFEVVAPDAHIINRAIDSDMKDFEDALQYHSAVKAKADYLLTRDPAGFPRSSLPVLAPDEFMILWRDRPPQTDEVSS